jgi:hypothetical protein
MNGPGLNANRIAHFTKSALGRELTRRSLLAQAGIAGFALSSVPSLAEEMVKLPLPSDPRERPITHDFPQKGKMILQRARPPLLERPWKYSTGASLPPTMSSMCVGIGP